MKIERKPQMNRVYVTGDVDSIRDLLYDFHARQDDHGYWLPIRMEPQLRAALKAETEYQAKLAAARADWDRAKSTIPADYKTRHGAMLGGAVRINGESFDEPALETQNLPWAHVATYQTRVRDLSRQSLINGRVQDSDILYVAIMTDGRPIYRISSSRGFGDDLRETYYMPVDVFERLIAAEIRMRGITPEAAREWLAKYRGCVGTELYEAAAATAMLPV